MMLYFQDNTCDEFVLGYYSFNLSAKNMNEKLGFTFSERFEDYCPALKKDMEAVRVKQSRNKFYKMMKDKNFEFLVIE